MFIPVFPGSALIEHQHAHLEAILKGELQPVKMPELTPTKTHHFLNTARRANFQPYAANLIEGEPHLFILLLPEERHLPTAGNIFDLVVGLFGETYEKGMTLFDFYLASEGDGNDVHIWQREALLQVRPHLEQKRARAIRAADHSLRAAEAEALRTEQLQDYFILQLERLQRFAGLIKNNTPQGKTGMALMSLHHGCNPSFFDMLDQRGVTYLAVVPKYERVERETREAPAQFVYTTVMYRTDWLFALGESGHRDKIQHILKDHGVTEEPITTSYHGKNEAGYARINRSMQIYTLSDAGVVTVELLNMRGENGDATRMRTLLTVGVPAAQRGLAETLGQYVHGI